MIDRAVNQKLKNQMKRRQGVKKIRVNKMQKRWNPEKLELKPKNIQSEEMELKFAELGKILYDGICQRLKESQSLHPGTIQQDQETELKRTGTDG